MGTIDGVVYIILKQMSSPSPHPPIRKKGHGANLKDIFHRKIYRMGPWRAAANKTLLRGQWHIQISNYLDKGFEDRKKNRGKWVSSRESLALKINGGFFQNQKVSLKRIRGNEILIQMVYRISFGIRFRLYFSRKKKTHLVICSVYDFLTARRRNTTKTVRFPFYPPFSTFQ